MGCSGLVSSGKGFPSGTYDGVVTTTQPMAPGGRRVLLAAPRGYCAGVDRAVITRGEGAGAVRASGLRPQADRAQQARRGDPRTSRSDVRRGDGRGARGRHRRLLRPRRRAVRARGSRGPRDCGRSTRRARWSPRSTTRRSASLPRAIRSCSSATRATRRSSGRAGRPPSTSPWSTGRRRRTRSRSPTRRGWPGCRRRRCRWTRRRRRWTRSGDRLPAAAGPAERRHLLRHPEPSVRGEGDGPRL